MEKGIVLTIILSSWRYLLLMLPVCVAAYVLFPQGWGWDIAMATVFVLTTVVIFFFMPNFVGKRYYEEVYVKLASLVQRKLHIK